MSALCQKQTLFDSLKDVLCGWLPRCKDFSTSQRPSQVQSCVRPVGAVLKPLALMVSVDRVPICFAGSNTLDIGRAVPIPGLTGSPSCRIVLAIVKSLGLFEQTIPYAVTSIEERCTR